MNAEWHCLTCGWHGETLGERGVGDERCCLMCDGDDLEYRPITAPPALPAARQAMPLGVHAPGSTTPQLVAQARRLYLEERKRNLPPGNFYVTPGELHNLLHDLGISYLMRGDALVLPKFYGMRLKVISW